MDDSHLYKPAVLRPSALGRILPLRSYIHPKIYGILSSSGWLVIPMISRVIYLRDYLLIRALELNGFRLIPDQHKDQIGLAVREVVCGQVCSSRFASKFCYESILYYPKILFPWAKHLWARSQMKFSQAFKTKQMLILFSPSILTL